RNSGATAVDCEFPNSFLDNNCARSPFLSQLVASRNISASSDVDKDHDYPLRRRKNHQGAHAGSLTFPL
ncbi:MAG: hypothetical protein BECKG1743F_GA0114225_100381, partial [Candidatus Kentron sp. G]